MPGQVLDKVLKKGLENVRHVLLAYLGTRRTTSMGIAHIAASWLRSDVSTSLTIDILNILKISSVRLSEKLLYQVTALLQHASARVRRAAVEALGGQLDLSQEDLNAVTSMLKDPNSDVRRVAVEVLRGRTDLSQEGLNAVTSILKDYDPSLRSAAVQILENQLSILPQSWSGLYKAWFYESFQQRLACYLYNGALYISRPTGFRRIDIGMSQDQAIGVIKQVKQELRPFSTSLP